MIDRTTDIEHPDADQNLTGLQERRGMITVVSVMMAAGAVMLTVISGGFAQPLPLILLSLAAMFGIFFLFAVVAGHIHIGDRLPETRFAATIAEQLEDAVMVTGRNGQIMWSNAAFRDLLRVPAASDSSAPGKKTSMSLKTIFGHSPEATEAMYRLSRVADEGAFHTEEIVCATEFVPTLDMGVASARNGQPHRCVYRVTVRPYLDGDQASPKSVEYGNLVYWTIQDVSEQRVREQLAVADLASELEFYNALPVGFIALDRSGAVQHVNATVQSWLGLKGNWDTAGGRDLADVLTRESADIVLRELRKTDASADLSGDLTGPRRDDENIVVTELDLLSDTGHLLPVRVTGKWDKVANGYVLALAKLNTGVESTFVGHEAAGSFQRFFQSAPFGIATVDGTGRILNANNAFARMVVDPVEADTTDSTMAELLTRNVDADVRETVESGLGRVRAGLGNVAPIDITVGHDRAHTRRVYMQPLAEADGTSEAAALYVIDVTEHKALEEQFAQSHKMEAVGKLAGGIAHDFNNVLTAIIGFSDLLLQTHRPTDPAHKDIMNIKQSADRAAGLVGKLLAFSRRQTFQTEVMHLGDNISDWAQFLKRSIGEKIDLSIKSDRDLWLVKSDKTQIEQVITNLSVNARDAMSDGGHLTINTRNIPERAAQKLSSEGLPRGEYVLIEVTDTGCGISDELQKKMFEPFFTTKGVGQGTGLGLSTVYGIVKQAGGFLLVDSELGEGTTFRIYLPRYDDVDYDHEAEKKKTKKEPPRDLTGTGCVLLVEDEDIVRQFAVRALKRQGYEVLEAASGLEALEVMAANDGKVDIVVSDVVMPEMDGPTLLKELRRTRPELKIIFVSGYPNEAFQEALGQEKFAFLPKPFSLPALAAKVKEEMAA